MTFPHRPLAINELFSEIGRPFFLVTRSIPDSSVLHQWLDEQHYVFMAGGTVVGENVTLPLRLSRAFDAIVFLPLIHPTVPLMRQSAYGS